MTSRLNVEKTNRRDVVTAGRGVRHKTFTFHSYREQVMRKFAIAASALIATLCLFLPTAPAQAQASRTWVSGVGSDANPCSRTAPCKTFAGAISKTAPGGEIDCLDPGGFGAVTITKSITIDCTATQAGILAAGVFGVTVRGPGIVVILRGLSIEGFGTG